MGRKLILGMLALCLVTSACKRVQIHQMDGDDHFRMTVPMFVIFQALRYTDEDVLEIDDLGGIDEEIPLYALAEAIRDGNDKIKVEMRQGDTHVLGEKRGNVFHISMNNPDEEAKLNMNLPVSLLDALMESNEGEVDARLVKRALKRYSGVLLEVESPDEVLRIIIK